MATGQRDDSAFVREVDEEVRRAEVARLWSRHGRTAMSALAVFLLALGALLWWRQHQASAREAAGERFNQVLARADGGAGGADLDALADNGPAGYAPLAKLTAAGLAARGGNTGKALGLYRAVAADGSLPKPLRDLAALRALLLEYDGLKPDVAIERLRPFAVAQGPWAPVAGELTAIAELRAGRPREAGQAAAAVARDPLAPPTLRARAEQLAISLGVDMDANQPKAPSAR